MSAGEKGPTGGIRVENVALPPEGKAVRVDVGGRPVAIFRVGGNLLAIDARCPHVGGPLDQGTVEGSSVVCPLHGSKFDLETGAVQDGPARSGVASYSVRVEGTTLVLERR
jgi:nitrite reductase/ring-hydroxylating ferredoxin subunit